MDVDGDVDSQLLQQFSSMATTDHEVLIAEFQTLLGNQLSQDNCAFFLDMNNWNLQAAICSYLEYQQPVTRKPPQMSFIKDITVGEGESVPPNTRFTKAWRIQNSGDEPWPPGCYLKFISGDQFGLMDCIPVSALEPGAFVDIRVEMTSPPTIGVHQCQWRMSTAVGVQFGECIWMIIQVDEGGVLAVTQLLSQFGPNGNESPSHATTSGGGENPFSSSRCTPQITGVEMDERIFRGEWPEGPGGTSVLRHSSLPSSPRYRGDCYHDIDDIFATDVTQEIPHVRPILFQTPDNSPRRTIGAGSKSETSMMTSANHAPPPSPNDFDMS